MEQLSLWEEASKTLLAPVAEGLPQPAPTTPELKTPKASKQRRATQRPRQEEGSEEDLEEWRPPERSRYEEAGEEERAVRDRLYAWGQAHDFPRLRFMLKAGVPLCPYYPMIASGQGSWRWDCHHYGIDVIEGALAFCETCDRGEATLGQYFAGW